MHLLRNLLLSGLVAILFLGLLEGVLRLTHLFGAHPAWTEPHPRYGWRYSPNRTYLAVEENDHPITGRLSNQGWRDHDRELEKPAGTYRVALLGDSFIDAVQVELDSTFASIAERDLRAAGHAVELLNFGRSGASQAEELLILEGEALRFDPDLVVLFFFPGNDIRDLDPRTASNPHRPFYRVGATGDLELDVSFAESESFASHRRRNALRRRSALVNLVVSRLQKLSGARRAFPEKGDVTFIPPALTACTGSPAAHMEANYALSHRLMVEMHRILSARGIDFLVVHVTDVYPPELVADFRRIDPSFDPDCFGRDLADLGAQHGFGTLDLYPPFRDRFVATGRPLTWGHWNYAGHRLVAGLLTQRVERRLP